MRENRKVVQESRYEFRGPKRDDSVGPRWEITLRGNTKIQWELRRVHTQCKGSLSHHLEVCPYLVLPQSDAEAADNFLCRGVYPRRDDD